MSTKDYRVLSDLSEIDRYDTLAVDTEGDSPHHSAANMSGISFSGEPFRALWLPIDRLDARRLTELLRRKRLVFHNAKYDLTVLERHGVDLIGCDVFDTMLAAHLLNENRPKGLKSLACDILGETNVVEFKDLTNQLNLFGKTPTLLEYACADADYTFRLYEIFHAELSRTPTLYKLFNDIEIPTMWVVRKMETRGIRLDLDHLETVGREYRERLQTLESVIFQNVGKQFTINSPIQLAAVLYDRLRLQVPFETRRGSRSVSRRALMRLRYDHLVVPLLLEYRQIMKHMEGYVTKLPLMVNPRTGRVHSSLHQAGTVTGRFSSSDPNLQAIPKDEIIRTAFIPEDGYVMIDVDFAQVELRCAAHYGNDPKMLAAFRSGVDLHKKTIADIANKQVEDVTPRERALAKGINFGLIYGMGPDSLSRSVGISLDEAKTFMDAYFGTYHGIRRIRQDVRHYAEKHRKVTSMFGRRRRFAGDDLRTAFNSLIQGTAADLCRVKMLELDRHLPSECRLLLQVHDEILFEVPEDSAEYYRKRIIEIMEAPITDILGRPFRCPIKVEAGIGMNWGAAEP